MLVYIFNFLKDSFNRTRLFIYLFFSHELGIFGKSSLCSWVVVVNLVKFELHVHHILSLASLVESILNFVWVGLGEILSVEVVIELEEHEIWVVVVLGVQVWLPVSTSKGKASV